MCSESSKFKCTTKTRFRNDRDVQSMSNMRSRGIRKAPKHAFLGRGVSATQSKNCLQQLNQKKITKNLVSF